MTKLQKLAQLELARRAIARELAEEEMETVAGGNVEKILTNICKSVMDIGKISIDPDAIVPSSMKISELLKLIAAKHSVDQLRELCGLN